MAKRLLFSDDARNALKMGIDTLADAVKVTLGPRGHSVCLDVNGDGSIPTIIDDGARIAREVQLANPFADMGAQFLKQAALKTNDDAGDGTTTATVLAQAIVRAGLRNVAAGADPMLLHEGIDCGVARVVAYIQHVAIPIQGQQELAQIATVAAADPTIGQLIADVTAHVGRDGAIAIEESRGVHDEIEYVEGMRIDRGYLAAYFVTDAERMHAVVEDASVLITDQRISAVADLVPLLEKFTQEGKRDLVIIAEDIEGDALAILVVNKLRGTLNIVAVKAPSFGDRRTALLDDLAARTGGTVLSEERGLRLASAELSHLGHARRVIATKDDTTFIEGGGAKHVIEDRVKRIRAQLKEATSEYDRVQLQERLAKLTGGVGVIRVGAGTETELMYRKSRMEDALSAIRSAVEEGYVPGGGVVLLNAISALDGVHLHGDATTGVMILRRALEEPMRQIAESAGKDGGAVVDAVRRAQRAAHDNPNIGYNALSDTIEDLVAVGIIDAAKVTRIALQNAASIAALILTTEVLVTDIPEPATMAPLG